ncbi:hypothetical protein JS532_05355 [Bifidobacterium callimiconis]|uniref:hypothetical protein n=1 Tax=Bifidobacterium callimiconis TaxID=2306973 RepID=UPI001BDC5A07|nr:hypothetical protein [Bifidobacterium callimiconis]MBT1176998.1 hypothetical protein [Bifidobacterium callimiconis]
MSNKHDKRFRRLFNDDFISDGLRELAAYLNLPEPYRLSVQKVTDVRGDYYQIGVFHDGDMVSEIMTYPTLGKLKAGLYALILLPDALNQVVTLAPVRKA